LSRIFRASARDVAIDTGLKWVAVSLNYLRPYWIQRLLEALSSEERKSTWEPRDRAYVYATFAFLSLAGASLAQLQHFHHARRVGMRLRSELTVAVYEKSLLKKISSGAQSTDASASTGKIVSLISDDTNKVLRWGCDWHVLAGAPLELILALGFLWNLMGWSGLAGLAILAIASPINYKLGQRAVAISRDRNAARDQRQTALQEMITCTRLDVIDLSHLPTLMPLSHSHPYNSFLWLDETLARQGARQTGYRAQRTLARMAESILCHFAMVSGVRGRPGDLVRVLHPDSTSTNDRASRLHRPQLLQHGSRSP
jgi:uncharacterized protein YfiM (DUF2279 family)